MNSEIEKINKYYTCKAGMIKRFDSLSRSNAMQADNLEEYKCWKQDTIGKLNKLIGLDKFEKTQMNPQIIESVKIEDDITREKVIIQVEDGVYMPMYILIPPKRDNNKQKCFIALAGHQGGGKYSVAGRRDIPAVSKMIDFYNYDYGLQMAKRGYVTLCPDPRGFGERREEELQKDDEASFLNSTCFGLAHMAELLGITVIGMCVWDTKILLDYIEQRNEWDLDEIGCMGFSGGGMQTLWASALDERIKKVIISGYLYGYKDSLLKLCNNCSCNYVPHLAEYVDMGDIAALIAPRPLMIQSCLDDHLNGERGMKNVYEQMETIKKAYGLFKKEDKIFHDIQSGGHKWHDENLDCFL